MTLPRVEAWPPSLSARRVFVILAPMNRLAQDLIRKFSEGRAVVGVFGLGYVGLPLALRFCEAGLRVIGFDIDPAKSKKIKAGRSYINYIPDAAIAAAVKSG